jgi:hypothetical protein
MPIKYMKPAICANRRPSKKIDQYSMWLVPYSLDLSLRGGSLLALAHPALASATSYDGEYREKHETNPAHCKTWANNMER